MVGLIARKISTALDDAIAASQPRPSQDFSLPLPANARARSEAAMAQTTGVGAQ